MKNKKIIYILIVIVLLIIIGILSYFVFFNDKITINTDGGKVINNIEIKDGEITTLPVIEKEGYKVIAYVNENKQIVRKGTKVTKKTKITPVYVKNNAEIIPISMKPSISPPNSKYNTLKLKILDNLIPMIFLLSVFHTLSFYHI